MTVLRVACLVGLAASLAVPARALELYSVRPTLKLAQDDAPSTDWRRDTVELDCARNERESFQLVVRSDTTAAGLSLAPSVLRGEAGATLTAPAIAQVAWVDVAAPLDPAKPSTHPSYRPDPLPPVDPATDRFSVEPGRNLVFWVTVEVPADARPGWYQGELRLQGAAAASLAVHLRVRGYALPATPILQSMIGLSEGNIYKAHGCTTPADKERVIRRYFDAYRRARLSPFLYAPGTMAFNPLPGGAIRWEFVKGADGTPTGEAKLDFTGFDREAATYLGATPAFSAFNYAPYLWTAAKQDGKRKVSLKLTDATGLTVTRSQVDGPEEVYDKLVVSVFRQIAEHFAAHGWLDRAIYYVTDEPGDDDTPAIARICRLVRQADPRLRTALTYDPANRPRLAELVDNGRSLVSVWIPYCTQYREDVAAEQRKKGASYWLYDVKDTCLITHSGETNRAMLWDVWRRHADGYLYYLSTYWPRDASPWDRPSFLLPGVTYQYQQGDGFFFYPPLRQGTPATPLPDRVVTSIRWELLREGAEDYDTLRLLERLTADAEAKRLPAAKLGAAALAKARETADALCGAASSYGIRDLEFTPDPAWSFGKEEGWLHHAGGQRSELPLRFKTGLPDGTYELLLNVYRDAAYRGKPYSRFTVDGRPYATPEADLHGPVTLPAGPVTVKDGVCAFTLGSVAEPAGVIVYHVGLRRQSTPGAGLYATRAQVADALEALTAALGR